MSIDIYFILSVIIFVNPRAMTMASFYDGNTTDVLPHNFVKRSATPPSITCSSSNEGMTRCDSTAQYTIWICINNKWVSYNVGSSFGKVKSLTADSCKHIKETSCNVALPSGLYWVQKAGPMQVHCDMTTDRGGWTLVWTHSYRETSPLSTNMYYFSDYHRNCTTYTSGWCNIPNKKRFNPTEQMIVAYHRGTVVYAYKGVFNYNIDHDWTGGVLVDFKKIVDKCTRSGSPNVQPAPSTSNGDRRLLGLAFDKNSPHNYLSNCDTIGGTFISPTDCRWNDCSYPTRYNTQQTVAIYVR